MTDISEIKQKSIIGVISYFFRSALLYFVAIVGTVLLSALLSPQEFGVYFVVTALIGVFTFFSDIGLAAALIQKREEPTLNELRTSFTIQQSLAIFICLITVGLIPIWQRYMGLTNEGIFLLCALSFSFIVASLKTIPSILLERKLQFSKLVIPQVVEQLVFYVVAVTLAYKHWGITSYTVAVLCRSIAGLIVMYGLQRWSIGLALSKTAIRGLLKFGVKFQLNDFLARLKDDLYIVVLAKFISQSDMGLIGWAKRWSMFPYQFSVQNVTAITFPTFSRVQNDLKMVAKGIEISIYFICLTIFPILTGMAILARPITELVPAYLKWQPALPALYFFCINIGLAALANPFISALNAMGKINFTLKLMVVMTLANWILTPLLWPFWGFLGVAIVAVLTAGISLSAIYYFKTLTSISWWHQIKIPLLASILMGLGVWWSQSWLPLQYSSLGIQTLFGVFSYCLIVFLIGKEQVLVNIRKIWLKQI